MLAGRIKSKTRITWLTLSLNLGVDAKSKPYGRREV
jgi:hypothetical protein